MIHTVKGFGFLIRENMRQEIPRGWRSPLTSYLSHPTIPPTHTYTHWVRTGSSAALRGRERSHSLHTCSESCMLSAIISLLAWSFKTGNTNPHFTDVETEAQSIELALGQAVHMCLNSKTSLFTKGFRLFKCRGCVLKLNLRPSA